MSFERYCTLYAYISKLYYTYNASAQKQLIITLWHVLSSPMQIVCFTKLRYYYIVVSTSY